MDVCSCLKLGNAMEVTTEDFFYGFVRNYHPFQDAGMNPTQFKFLWQSPFRSHHAIDSSHQYQESFEPSSLFDSRNRFNFSWSACSFFRFLSERASCAPLVSSLGSLRHASAASLSLVVSISRPCTSA